MAVILIVDDELEICTVMKMLIEETTEHSVVTLNNASDALEYIEATPPQMLITDIKMPGKDGLWLIDQVRDLLPDMPVIMMSGFTSATPQEINSRSPEAFIQKPEEISKVIDLIHRLL